MHVFAFDRDWTVDVNPHPHHEAVPMAWVRQLAHETDHAVYAIGNQDLAAEAAIPGVVDIVGRHGDDWDDWLGGKQPDGRYERFPSRRERLGLIADLHPDAEGYVVVDDLDLSDIDGWEHYHAWEFVPAVKRGDIDPALPWARDPVADGGSTTSAGIAPIGPDHLESFLDEQEDAPGYELTDAGDCETRTRLLAAIELVPQSLDRPAAAPAVRCQPLAPAGESFTVRVADIEQLSVVDPPADLYTAGADTPSEKALGLRRLAQADPESVPVSKVLTLLDSPARDARDDALRALHAVARVRPEDCTPALPILRSILDSGDLETPAGTLATLRLLAAADPADVAPLVDVIGPYLTDSAGPARREAARTLGEIAAEAPEDVLDAVPALATILEDDAPGQSYALYALSCVSRDYPEAIKPVAEPIATRVVDEDLPSNTRLNATAALGRVVDEYPDVGPEIVDDVAVLLDADDVKLRANAAGLLSDLTKHDPLAAEPNLDRLVELVTVDDDYTRINASAAVSRLAEVAPHVIAPHADTFATLLEDGRELVRLNACWALGHLGDHATEALPELEALRKREGDSDVLTRAQWAITEIEE